MFAWMLRAALIAFALWAPLAPSICQAICVPMPMLEAAGPVAPPCHEAPADPSAPAMPEGSECAGCEDTAVFALPATQDAAKVLAFDVAQPVPSVMMRSAVQGPLARVVHFRARPNPAPYLKANPPLLR